MFFKVDLNKKYYKSLFIMKVVTQQKPFNS